ncbi:MAG TPA: TIGR00730 family Rossman fold protein [Candidatus Dormibacteraeota bacterium]|nr:TIGR00730 family Rossman fold protein [Candidatus Dormibacteraeota bacterium]
MRVCIFCGARSGRGDIYRAIARDVARAIVARGDSVVYGGGRVGMMGALADAALEAGGEVIGVIPEALASAEIAHQGITTLHVVDSMHARKALLTALSDAFVALPGGIGTMDELFEALTWHQLGIHDKPVGILNAAGYYDPLFSLLDRMFEEGLLPASTRSSIVTGNAIEALLEELFAANRRSAHG